MRVVHRIAYLAPEIPATSATFVSDEILELRRRGFVVLSYSIHRPAEPAEDPATSVLRGDTRYLYDLPALMFVAAFFWQALRNPGRFLGALGRLLLDIVRVVPFSDRSFKLAGQFTVGCHLAKRLQGQAVQHLHAHFSHVPAQVGMYAALLAGIPFTFTAHANDIFQQGILLKQKAARAKKVIAISEYNREYLVSRGVESEKVAVVRCGVRLPETLGERGKGDGRLRIGSLGRLVEKKGMDTLIAACRLLADDGVDFSLRIAGSGPQEGLLREQVADLSLADRIRFEGTLRHDLALDWLRGLDIFALACRLDPAGDMDGIPVVLIEAMACGTPVISTRISGIPELIEHDVSGILSKPGDASSLAAGLQRMAVDPELRLRLAENGRKRVAGEFSRDLNVQRLMDVLTG
jgi:glycosyltransferase involved in cell wall biosynthesis